MKLGVSSGIDAVDPTTDLFVGALGYESRCVHALESAEIHGRKLMVSYEEQGSKVFRYSRLRALELGAVVVDARDDTRFDVVLADVVSNVADGLVRHLTVDISSLGRWRIARIVGELMKLRTASDDLVVDFLYSPAEFTPPSDLPEGELSAETFGRPYIGSLRALSLPLAAVMGLGYELQRAAGAFELLQPNRTWAFLPDSDDSRYTYALLESNRNLLQSLTEQEVLDFPVLRPAVTFNRLLSLVSAASRDYRVVLIPMGPKIFSLVAFLVALSPLEYRPAVWRVGSRRVANPVDAVPRGPIVGLRLTMM